MNDCCRLLQQQKTELELLLEASRNELVLLRLKNENLRLQTEVWQLQDALHHTDVEIDKRSQLLLRCHLELGSLDGLTVVSDGVSYTIRSTQLLAEIGNLVGGTVQTNTSAFAQPAEGETAVPDSLTPPFDEETIGRMKAAIVRSLNGK